MHSLYSEENLRGLRRQIRSRRLVLLGIFLVGAAGILLLLLQDNHKTYRPELAVTLLLILTGAGMIFFYDLMIHPLQAYARHLETALHGRTHETRVVFDHLNEEESLVEGVVYRDLIFLGDADKHGDRERMFYWDRELPLPAFAAGQEVHLKYYDRFITGYEVLS